MSRRQTLGAFSPSQLNAGALRNNANNNGNAAKDGKQPGKSLLTGRASMAPLKMQDRNSSLGLERRSSAFGKTSGVKQDPRPLNDKNYLASCVRTVIGYLSTHGYPYALSPKTLTTPTGKEFAQMVQFLMQKFDPNIKTFGKVEDEVPLLFKRLNYPFQISKSALFAVGSPHSWPAVLAALTWLVELLNYEDRSDDAGGFALGAGAGNFDDKQRGEREFYQYVATSYKHFLAGDDSRCQAADEEMLAQFHAREAELLEELHTIKQANQSLKARLEQMRSEPSPLLAAQQKRSEHMTDADKFGKLIDNLQTLKQQLQRKVSERQADLTARKEQMAAITQDNAGLQQRIAGQSLSKADVNRMLAERAKQRELLQSVSMQREALEAKVYEQERQVEKQLESLETSAQQYNTCADRLQLIPATAKRAEGIAYELEVNRAGCSASELVNTDLKALIKPGLQRLRESYRTKARELSNDVLGLREQLDGIAEAIHERLEDRTNQEAQLRKLEAQHRSVKESIDADVRAKHAQAEKLAADVAALRSSVSGSLAESEERVRVVQAEQEALQRQCDAEVAKLHGELSGALKAILDHRLHIKKLLDDTQNTVGDIKQEVADMEVPQVPALA